VEIQASRPGWLHWFELRENKPAVTNDLNVETVAGFGVANRHPLFIVGHDCHGGNLPLSAATFKFLNSFNASQRYLKFSEARTRDFFGPLAGWANGCPSPKISNISG
jgi:hypothetical protein